MPPARRAATGKAAAAAPSKIVKGQQQKSAAKSTRARLVAALNSAPTQKFDVYVFGSGEYGELGLGSVRREGKMPTGVKRPRLNDLLGAQSVGVVQLDVGGMHTVALTCDNRILTWGVNDNGALGRDTKWTAPVVEEDDEEDDDEDDAGINPRESTPEAIPGKAFGEGVRFVQVAATDSASFALTDDGLVYGWGTFRGNDGVIGFSKKSLAEGRKVQNTPVLIPELKNIKLLAAGGNHVQALDSKGNVFSWGSGEQGQLGRYVMENYRTQALTPSQFGLPKTKIKYIAAGSYHSFAIDKNDKVYAWGLSNFGQTGIPTGAGEDKSLILKPEIVKALEKRKISDIQGGTHHSVACTEDGELLVWGRCDDSQMGIDLDTVAKKNLIFDKRDKPRILIAPTVVPNIRAVQAAAGIDDVIAIAKDGSAFSFGFSSNYRTGQGTEDSIKLATKIDNSAVRGKKLTFAGCGGQFSVLAGPATLKD